MLKADAQMTGTKARIVEAAVETLRTEGFAGSSVRAIARTGGFNQALVFYHFGSVTDLLLAALDRTADERMARYRDAVEGASTLPELMAVAARIYREDLDAGHIKVLAELVAGASSVPRLGAALASRLEPWVAFAEDAIDGVLPAELTALLPPRDLAYGVVALYLGVELLTHLEGDTARTESLFAAARRLGEVAEPLLGLLGGAA